MEAVEIVERYVNEGNGEEVAFISVIQNVA
jgi:hypothetical protein